MSPVRRFISLAILLFFAVPLGMSVSGCKKALVVDYCNGGDSGPQVGQVATITLSPSLATYGESLNYGQTGQSLSAFAADCKGNSVSVPSYTYASTNLAIADINPASGQACAGTFNRFVGGGVPNFTTCTGFTAANQPPGNVAYFTATAQGAVSNAIPVFIHPIITSIAIGNPSTNCTADPTSNCSTCLLPTTAPGNPTPYTGSSCLSQGATAQLVARVFAGTTNITCQVGHLGFSPEGSGNILAIDENGVATANQPGSVTILASVANSGSASTAGFFSTCPPTNITLSVPGQTGPTATAFLNNPLPFSTTVTDKNGTVLTGLNLEYNSTSQQTIPTSGNSVTSPFPGTGTVTAVCQPGSCNPAPYSQIGYNGNGTALTSNGITVNTAGSSSTVLYIGSTSSQYLYPVDFTTSQPASLIKLPYVPNSMIMNQNGTTIYLGSSSGLMTVSATTGAYGGVNTTIVGTVISVSPDGNTIIVTDPNRKTVNLVNSGGSVTASYGGVATEASWAPDSQTVYITGTDPSNNPQLLVHSAFTNWTAIALTPTTGYSDVTVTVPHVGAYLAGGTFTDGRSYCPSGTATAANPPVVTNSFYPLVDTETTAMIDRITSTNDGNHILGASAANKTLTDIAVSAATLKVQNPCNQANTPTGPGYFTSSVFVHPLTGIVPTLITGVLPATNSTIAFVTYAGTAGTAGQLPFYYPSTGTLSVFKLSGTAGTPVSGVFSSDNLTFYTGTTTDNAVHLITLTYPLLNGALLPGGLPVPSESPTLSPILPNLPNASGSGIATPNLIAQRPRKSTT